MENLTSIEYAPIALVSFVISKCLVKTLDGFGLLFANEIYEHGQKKIVNHSSCLGTIWSSELFDERNMSVEYLMTSFMGGARNTGIANCTLNQIQDLAIQEQIKVLNPLANKALTKEDFRIVDSLLIPKAIPQYNIGHGKLINDILGEIKNVPNLAIIGNYFDGISLYSCSRT